MIQQFHFQLKRTETRDSKRHLHTYVYSSMIHRRQKQSKCPLMGELISKMLSIQLMEYYRALKRKEILT